MPATKRTLSIRYGAALLAIVLAILGAVIFWGAKGDSPLSFTRSSHACTTPAPTPQYDTGDGSLKHQIHWVHYE